MSYFGVQDNFIFKIVLLDRFDCTGHFSLNITLGWDFSWILFSKNIAGNGIFVVNELILHQHGHFSLSYNSRLPKHCLRIVPMISWSQVTIFRIFAKKSEIGQDFALLDDCGKNQRRKLVDDQRPFDIQNKIYTR